MSWFLAICCMGLLIASEYLREDRDYWRQKVQDIEDEQAINAANRRYT